MKALITGARGWLGKAVTEVVAAEHDVRTFDLITPDIPTEPSDAEVDFEPGSVTDYLGVRAAAEGQNAVIHAAVRSTLAHGHYSVGEAEPFDVNVRGTFNVLEAARHAGAGRVVLITSAETHVEHAPGEKVSADSPYMGRPDDIYDLTKHLQEEVAAWFAGVYSMDIVALRLGDIVDVSLGRSKWGEDDWIRSLAEDAWIDRYDVGRACLGALALKPGGYRRYHLVGAPGAREVFDVERAEADLGLRFTTEFDRRPGGERD
ncbi:MAG: NAD(P)-dependent oxidoreductase [Chloroflexi bacterium]|nr:NAD(P)-dependent oxidoreductase [Chloroflexota bacterium]